MEVTDNMKTAENDLFTKFEIKFMRIVLRLRSDDGNLALLNNHHHKHKNV